MLLLEPTFNRSISATPSSRSGWANTDLVTLYAPRKSDLRGATGLLNPARVGYGLAPRAATPTASQPIRTAPALANGLTAEPAVPVKLSLRQQYNESSPPEDDLGRFRHAPRRATSPQTRTAGRTRTTDKLLEETLPNALRDAGGSSAAGRRCARSGRWVSRQRADSTTRSRWRRCTCRSGSTPNRQKRLLSARRRSASSTPW